MQAQRQQYGKCDTPQCDTHDPKVGVGIGTSDVGSLVVITRTNTPVLRYSMQRVSIVFEIFKWGGLRYPDKRWSPLPD